LFKESPSITNLVRLCFFIGVWSVEGSDRIVQFKSYSRPIVFNGFGADGTKQRFDTSPFQRGRSGLREDGLQGAELLVIRGITL
jgi:hypothetical protein